MKLLLFLIVMCARTMQKTCIDNASCLVSDNEKMDLLQLNATEFSILEETTTELFTTQEVETTTTIKSTTKPPATTTPPVPKPVQPSAVCWCDKTGNVCDMNCCCDPECSLAQKQVFTQCADPPPIYDEKYCYSSNIFYKKPKDFKSVRNQGLFCVVRDNFSTMKEFKEKRPISTIDEFKQSIRKVERFGQSNRQTLVPKFLHQAYRAGSTVWSTRNGSLAPFHILKKTFGNLCLTTLPVAYLTNVDEECSWRIPRTEPMCSQTVNYYLSKLRNPIVVSPLTVNITDIKLSLENCTNTGICIPLQTFLCKQSKKCSKFDKLSLKSSDCASLGLDITINFFHNGSEGIQSASAFIQLLNTSTLKTRVKFLWSEGENDGFVRSGNPGYLKGKPILSGWKMISIANDSSGKREAIELTKNPKGWISTFGNDKGQCSQQRQTIVFNENVRKLCFLQLQRQHFSKNGCIDLQKTIFELLIQDSKENLTNFNRYLGVYGNARVEVISDWLQILVDYFPLMSTQAKFTNSSYGMSCTGIFSHVYLDIAIAKFGSFYNPQMKIVGALVRFAPAKDYFVRCKAARCDDIAKEHTLQLMTEVTFVDVSKPAERKFAQPPGLEAKLPHDFFYPFFAFNKSGWHLISPFLLIVSLVSSV